MKLGIILSACLATLVLLFTSSCSEEIDMVGDRQETAVIYGLLDQTDSIHYVKINRAFLGPGNAYEIAQIPDSNYFQQVEATVTEIINGNAARTWTLEDTLLENKEPGVFYAPEQKMYFFKTASGAPLIANANTTYKLDVNINEGKYVISGETPLVQQMSIVSPSVNASYSFASADISQNGYKNTTISFAPGTAKIADVSLIVSFDEYIGTVATTKSFSWRIGDFDAEDMNGTNKSASASGATFYSLIKQNATDNPAITRRKLKSIRVNCTGGSEELQKYIVLNKPSSSLAQSKPTYTNLTATNGARVIGIFSARCTAFRNKNIWTQNGSTTYKALDQNSMKELTMGTITGALLFCSDVPSDLNQPFFCN